MKKKLCLVFLFVVMLVLGLLLAPKETHYEYLRIHILANSNAEIDQNVKYEIKDKLVEFMTDKLSSVKTKSQAIEEVETYKAYLESICNGVLKSHALNYLASIAVVSEYFPSRTYSNTTLEAGVYDAIKVELGEAVGDNWWCVMYPPLCFVNKTENDTQVKYKSRIVEWIKSKF